MHVFKLLFLMTLISCHFSVSFSLSFYSYYKGLRVFFLIED